MNRQLKLSLLVFLALFLSNFFVYAEGIGKEAAIDAGKKVKMNFTMKSDGALVDSTEGKKPFEFVYGERAMIPGLAEALKGLKAGDKKHLSLTPEQAFGSANPKAVVEFPKTQFKQQDIQTGMIFNGQTKSGAPLRGIVKEVKKDSIVIDFNHPLAGKNLDLDFEILEVA